MLTHEENQLLCRVEGEAPMGQMMRRHWVPALLSEQLVERDGDPVKVRLFGEDLVAFRDSEGRIGVMDEKCPHRKASLVFARNEECGLRCLYHGWKIDVDGNVTDMPSEPVESGFAKRVKHKTYPTREAGGFIWVYMGPAAQMPEFETPSWAVLPDNQISIVRMEVQCNWAQVMEGQIDSAHSSVLHSTDMRPARVTTAGATETHWTRPSTDKNPRIHVQRTNYGMRYAAIRRPIQNGDTHDYVRITTYVAPFIAHIPPNSSYNVASVIVPKDDDATYFHFLIWGDPATTIDQAGWRKFCCATVGEDLDRDYKLVLRSASNNYLQDRKAMRDSNFTGISGIPTQDIAMWESMGKVSDRTSERLGASDIAVVEFRRLMIEAVQRFIADEGTIGLMNPRLPQAKLCSYQSIVAKSEDWRMLGASEEEKAYLKGLRNEPRLSAASS
jgi:phthalate 4,5-dioxygenase oxygenase subunit